MKILWVINIILPQIAKEMNEFSYPIGGWMVKLFDLIGKETKIELSVCFPYSKNVSGKVKGVAYHSFRTKMDRFGNERWVDEARVEEIITNIRPDIIHLFGTEFPHSNKFMKIAIENGRNSNIIVTIQGLISQIAKHYYAHLPIKIVRGRTARDYLKGNIEDISLSYTKRGIIEIDTIKNARYIIGRTEWDKENIHIINNHAIYFHNDEMLRNEFYRGEIWNYNTCIKHSIFVSQASTPIKGFHIALEILSFLLKDYPDCTVYVAGYNIFEKRTWKMSKYERYLQYMVRSKHLTDHIHFLGFLDEINMKKQYLKSNVYLSASTIENSSNAICEAMILGVPVVCSDVGGTSSLLNHRQSGFLFPSDDPVLAAHYIKTVFENTNLREYISKQEIKTAINRHNYNKVFNELIAIYNKVMENNHE